MERGEGGADPMLHAHLFKIFSANRSGGFAESVRRRPRPHASITAREGRRKSGDAESLCRLYDRAFRLFRVAPTGSRTAGPPRQYSRRRASFLHVWTASSHNSYSYPNPACRTGLRAAQLWRRKEKKKRNRQTGSSGLLFSNHQLASPVVLALPAKRKKTASAHNSARRRGSSR